MTQRYVRSGAGGAGTGADWANAYTTLAAAFAAASAGDTIFVSEDHAESSASEIQLNSPGTLALPCLVLCVDHAGSVPPVHADLRTTATISTTGSAALKKNGFAYYYGMTFTAGSAASSAAINLGTTTAFGLHAKNCSYKIGGSGAGQSISVAPTATTALASRVIWDNVTVRFGSTNSGIYVKAGYFEWKNTASAILAGSIPSSLFRNGNAQAAHIVVEGVDLSAVTSTLVESNNNAQRFFFKNCKLNAAVAISAAQAGDTEVYIVGSDPSTPLRQEKHSYRGALTTETTIVRTGGASDGETPYAWKIVTTANAQFVAPFVSLPIAVWNATEGEEITATLYGIWGDGAAPDDNEIWMEVGYLGDASSPLDSFVSSAAASPLAAASALASDGSTWGGSTTKFKMSVSFTPEKAGLVYAVVKVAAASATFYVDPKIDFS